MILRIFVPKASLALLSPLEDEGCLLVPYPPGKVDDLIAYEACDLVIISEGRLGSAMAERLESWRNHEPRMEVVVSMKQADPLRSAELLSQGALGIVHESLGDEEYLNSLRSIVQRLILQRRATLAQDLSPESGEIDDFASRSPQMREVLEMARKVASSDSNLLLMGETGVGKDYLATCIHAASLRAGKTFLPVNCAAFAESLFEAELFGHVRGSFTGADRSRKGLFELAHGGTLFMDEVGELDLHLQAKLLSVIEDRRVRPVGAETSIPVDVRLIAATNRDLAEDVRAGRFRQDLYYRLNVVPLRVPPLRERREDIPEIALSQLKSLANRLGKPNASLTPEALQALVNYPWPGNVRELINALERSLLLSSKPQLEVKDLPPEIAGGQLVSGAEGQADLDVSTDRPWGEVRAIHLLRVEQSYFVKLLRECKGVIGETARRAGISPRALNLKMQVHSLDKRDFR